MPLPFRVVAIIAAHNEADIIPQVVDDLIRQRIQVYVLDNGSTDGTVAALEPFLGQGLLRIEAFPDAAGGVEGFDWTGLLRRKEELATEIEADWFIHHDADEFRESPWMGFDLASAVRQVDEFGYNAIDFEVLNFWPTHDRFQAPCDVREAFPYFERGEAWDKTQIKCWKRQASRVDLASSGGHEALFPERRVFPIRFVLRHYPIRSQQHAERKVFSERLPRFRASEREQGWHCQYMALREGQSFLRDPQTLTRYDPARVRLELMLRHREVEALEASPSSSAVLLDQAARYSATLESELHARNLELAGLHRDLVSRGTAIQTLHVELGERNREVQRLHTELHARNQDVEGLHRALDEQNRAVEGLGRALDLRNSEIDRLHRELDARNRAVEHLERALDLRNSEVDRLHRELDDRNRQIQGSEAL